MTFPFCFSVAGLLVYTLAICFLTAWLGSLFRDLRPTRSLARKLRGASRTDPLTDLLSSLASRREQIRAAHQEIRAEQGAYLSLLEESVEQISALSSEIDRLLRESQGEG